jgi:hypothetical protein
VNPPKDKQQDANPSRRNFITTAAISLAMVGSLTPSGCCVKGPGLDTYGGWTGLQGQKTGFFHLENIEGRDWFITPEGNVFFAVALSHLYSGESNTACDNVYGGDADGWLRGSIARAKEMGFNCALGNATSPERSLNGFVDMDKAERGDFPRNENGFMDPFEKFHTEWTDVIREVNANAADLHQAAQSRRHKLSR